MALANGANLALEIPFVHACGSGSEFARGSIGILAAARFVTHLAFGAEDASDFSLPLRKPLSILIQEPDSFKLNLRKNLDAGCSYPKALALALESECPGSWKFVSKPNNALAVSYLAEIQRKGHRLIPVPVQREGGARNDETPGSFARLAGATAIRKALSGGAFAKGRNDVGWVKDAVPTSVMPILKEELDNGRLCLEADKLWNLLRGLLSRSAPEELRACAGMEEGLENLFLKHYARANSFDDFIGRCVCARYTRGRLQRQAIRCLAGLDRWTWSALSRTGPPYIRVLGYDDLGRGLLRERKKIGEAAVPVITRLAAARGAIAKTAADVEFRASRLRELLLSYPDLTREERLAPGRDRPAASFR
jgi:predicted nucleotidyltransferase